MLLQVIERPSDHLNLIELIPVLHLIIPRGGASVKKYCLALGLCLHKIGIVSACDLWRHEGAQGLCRGGGVRSCVHSVPLVVRMVPLGVVLGLVGSLRGVAGALSVRLNKFAFGGRAYGQGWSSGRR